MTDKQTASSSSSPSTSAPAMTMSVNEPSSLNEPEDILTLGGIISRGWFLFTFQRGKQLLTAVLGGLPVALLFALVMSLQLVGEAQYSAYWYVGLVVFEIVYILYLPSIFGAVICLTSAAHHGEPISILTAYRRAWQGYFKLLLAIFGVYGGAMLGMCLLIVPGLIFVTRYGLAWVIVPIEKCSVGDAFARSRQLLQGRKKVFLLVQLVFFLLTSAVIGSYVVCVLLWGDVISSSIPYKFVAMFVLIEADIVVTVPYIPMLVAFYFDCVKRNRRAVEEV